MATVDENGVVGALRQAMASVAQLPERFACANGVPLVCYGRESVRGSDEYDM